MTDAHLLKLRRSSADDKAGAYAIQGGFRKYIREFIGDYENVVGLPYSRIISELNK